MAMMTASNESELEVYENLPDESDPSVQSFFKDRETLIAEEKTQRSGIILIILSHKPKC